jgi:hypothetical protein
MVEIYSMPIVDIRRRISNKKLYSMINKRDGDVSIVCLSCHFDVGLFPCHRARGTPLVFSMIHACLQWQELAWDLSRVAWGLDIRISQHMRFSTYDLSSICFILALAFTLTIQDAYDGGQWELTASKYHNFLRFINLQSLLPSTKGLSFTFMLSLHLLPLCTF